MKVIDMHIQVLIIAIVVAIAALGPASGQEAVPACETSCGNVAITFPFGSREGCYHSSDFLVTCDRSSGEPIPYFGNTTGNIVISNMSTGKSEVEVMMFVASDCYNGTYKESTTVSLRLRDFRISAKNKFVAIGCDTHALVSGTRGNVTDGMGCISRCGRNSLITNRTCSGVGCCEASVPEGIRSFNITLRSYTNHTNIIDFNPCSFGFFVEEGKFNFSISNLRDFRSVEKMPMLLDWAIGNLTCELARQDTNKFLCKGNSKCDQDYDGPGYRCNCIEGYEGPYIENDCKNINECEQGNHGCEHKCIDTEGSYTCSCRKGYSRDKSDEKGCIQDQSSESTLIKIVVATSAAAVLLLIFVTWLYLGLKRRKLIMLREKFFRQNGGLMLQQRISGDAVTNDRAKVFTIEELKKATNPFKNLFRPLTNPKIVM